MSTAATTPATSQTATPAAAPAAVGTAATGTDPAAYPTVLRGDHVPGVAPVLSVVIATYNRLDSLLWLLDDLKVQVGHHDVPGRPPMEVIVVDDGGSAPVLDEIGSRDYPYPVRALRRPNGGPGVARDTGIRLASGDIVVILDDDMVVPEGFLAAHLAKHREGAEVVLGTILPPRAGVLPLFERFHLEGMQRFAADYRAGRAPVEGTRLCTGNVSFRRDAYLEVGGFDLSLHRCEDRDLGIRFELAGKRFSVTEDGWSEHRSDHEDVATWRRRSRLFGELDTRIAAKHPSQPKVSPWSFLPVLPVISRPFLVAASLVPMLGTSGASVSYRLGEEADRRARPRLAMIGASMCYALEYFAGVGTELRRGGGTSAVLRSLQAARRARSAVTTGTSR